MIMSNFLRNRKSVREFKNRIVEPRILEDVQESIRALKDEYSLDNMDFRLYENGKNLYSSLEGKGGYAGVMIESPHYIIMELADKKEDTILYGAYYMEKLITKLNDMGLSTCWVSVSNIDENLKKEVFGEHIVHVDYVLAFGYEKLRNPFTTETFSERIGVKDMVFDGEIGRVSNLDDLDNKGLLDIFHYVRFAPSTKNLQPWRFLIKDNKIQLLLSYKEWNEGLLIDAGIIMYYFEELAKYQGIKSQWRIVDIVECKTEDNCYRYVAEYEL